MKFIDAPDEASASVLSALIFLTMMSAPEDDSASRLRQLTAANLMSAPDEASRSTHLKILDECIIHSDIGRRRTSEEIKWCFRIP